ncbi:MAG: hypothetical protein J6Q51_03815, partial [Clostridia bacterium]|nr:hypothetical protein [Clostridia bacterium]
MKKFVTYIFAFICLLSAGLFAACSSDDGKNAGIYFNETYLELVVGDQLDLASHLFYENIEFKDIRFSSLDNNILVISDGKVTAVGAGTTLVRAESTYTASNLEIKVKEKPQDVGVPTGLIYDLNGQCISWNHVLVKVGEKIQEVNSYTISLTAEGVTKEITVTGANKYTIEEGGNFTIQVKCNPLVMDGITIYGGSKYSEPITVRQLSKPTNIQYDDSTNLLSWDCGSDVESFQVKINGVIYQSTKQNQFVIDLSSTTSSLQQQVYKVSVVSEKAVGQKDGDVVAKAESETVTYTRLYAPTLNIDQGVVTWDNTQKGNFHYELVATNSSGTQFTIPIQNNQFSATQLSTGTYSKITIRAIGDDASYLDSINDSKIENIVKLAPATISYNPVTQVITASNHDNRTVELHITYKNTTERIRLPKPSYQYTWQKTEVGDYSLLAYVYADDNTVTEINSEASNKLTLKQLAQVDTVTVSQKAENGKYYLEHKTVENATLYEYVIKNGNNESYVLKQADGSLGYVDKLFSQVGTYSVAITASSTQNLGTNTFILPSRTSVSVIRQADITTLTYNNNNLNWSTVSTANSYSYYASKNGNTLVDVTTTTANSYSTINLAYGEYKFFVKANGWSNANVLYLDSLNYTEVAFSIAYNLETPQLEFDRTTHIATFNKVDHALDYIVTLNEDYELAYYEYEGKLAVNLLNKLNEVGDYVVQVQAVNYDDELILDSSKERITITRLAAPTKFNLSADGILKITNVPSSTMLDATTPQILTINNQNVKILDKTSSAYVVRSQFIANTQRVGDNYYLDSDTSTFTISRLSTPIKPELNETVVSWVEMYEKNFEYRINVTQNDISRTIALKDNQIDVFDIKLGSINLSSDFTVSVGYDFKGSDIDLTQSRDVKYTSFFSDPTLIHKIKSNVKMYISETSAATTVNWDKSEDVQNATYQLYLDGSPIYTGNANSYDLTESIMNEKDYTLRLKITKPGYLDSEYVVIHLERLEAVTKMSIDDNENIFVKTDYLPTQLESIKITKDGQDITNLSAFGGKFEVKVQLTAKTYTEGEYYYLSSKVSTFNFTRISTLSQPLVDDNAIAWDTINGVKNFRLAFGAGEKEELLSLSNQNIIPVTNNGVKKIFKTLASNEMTVKVQAVISKFDAQKDNEYPLSSYYSEASRITLLQKVQNIKLESNTDDVYQQDVRISWDFDFSGVKVKQTDIDIYHNGRVIAQESITGTATSIVSEDMREPGVYFAKIRILGDSFCIDSDYETSLTVTRLEAPTELSIDQNCVFKWSGVNNAVSYNVSYFFNDQIKGELNNITKTKWDLSREMYGDKFGGFIKFNVIAVGGQGKDEYKTLSSPVSQECVVTKLTQGTIRLYSDKFIAGAEIEDEFDGTSKYLVTISNNGRIVLSEEFDYNDEFMFGDFVYQDTNEKVDTRVEQDFIFTVQRINYETNFIKSDTVERQVVKLKQPENLGFVRKSDGIDSKIWLQCNIDANAIGYELVINGLKYSDFSEIGLIAEIPLVDELYNKISSGEVEFKINKKGFILETGISYIDSAQTTITARKLETPDNFGSNNGVISWNMVDRASDYLIKVNNTEILSGYIVDDVHTLNEKFEGRAGDLRLNIKAKGNVGTTVLSTNVILDSSYILKNGTTEIADYQCRKLYVPENFRGVNGYLAITENTEDKKSGVKYQALIENVYYDLITVGKYDGNAYALLYSDEIYQSLQDNTKYLVRVRAISSDKTKAIVYSELSTSIYIKIIPNTIRGTLEFSLNKISDDPVKYDYSKSQVNWAEAEGATNGYKVIINSTEFETNLTSYDLESDDFKVTPVIKNEVKVLIKGDSFLDEDGCYKLDSRPTEPLEFYKLDAPTPKVEQGKLAWEKVTGASGYLIYLDNSLLFEDPINATMTSVDVGDIGGNITYSKFQVKAVSTSPNRIASEPGLYTDELGKAKSVTKLHAPYAFSVEDGVLKWNLTDEAMMNYIWGRVVDMPFTFDVNMVEGSFFDGYNLKNNLVNNEGDDGDYGDEGEGEEEEMNIYEFIDRSSLYIELKFVNNDTQVETILRLNPMLFLSFADDYKEEALKYSLVGAGGWPTISYEYDDGNWNPECGSYTYYLRQPGDNVEYLESNFSMPQDLYIPFSPQIKITYKTNLYTLKWDAISIPEYYNMPNPVYQVIVEDINGVRSVIAETTQTTVNLTELIENGTLGAIHKKLYVIVKGNSSNVLNGKKSNIITLEVLDAIDAYIQDGRVIWSPQEAAGEYIITYTEAGRPDTKKIVTKRELVWNCEELSSDVEYYYVTINAVGQTITTYTHATLTGQTTDIGKIRKLKDPSVYIENGLFRWQAVDNCENYAVYITKPGSELERIRIPALIDANKCVWYESIYSEANIFYQFRAMGELDSKLDANSDSYVNSNLLDEVGIYGSVLKSVRGIRASEGELVWDIVKNGELYVNYYKLTFNKVNDEGTVIDSKQVITGGNFRKSAESYECVYGVEDLPYGKYKVVIQPYYTTSQDEGKYPYNGVAAYHLIGLVVTECYFEKYNVVEGFDTDGSIIEDNLTIKDGEFKWQYAGEYDLENYDFELKFISNLGESITHRIAATNFIDNIVEELTPTETYELSIRVVPKEGVEGYVNSDYIVFKNIKD